MISETIIENIVTTFSEHSEKKVVYGLPCALSEYEQKFCYTVKEIATRFYCFKHYEPVFTHLFEIAKDKQIIADLKKLLNENIDVLLKGKINDFLWVTQRDVNTAKQALVIYKQLILSNNDFEWQYYLFIRLTNIQLSVKDKGFEFEYKSILYKMIEFGETNDNALSVNILELAYDMKLLSTDELLTPVGKKLEQLLSQNNQFLTEDTFKLMEKLLFASIGQNVTLKPTKDKKITELRRKKAEMYIKYAKNSVDNNHLVINYLKSAIKTLKGIYGTEEQRADLHAQLCKAQKSSMDKMHTFTHKIDLTKEVNYYREIIEILENKEALYFFILGFPILSQDKVESSMLNVYSNSLSKHMFMEVVQTKNGKTKAVLPSWTEALKNDSKKLLLPHTEQYLSESYKTYVNCGMIYVLGFIKEQNNISKEHIEHIVSESYFVSEKRRTSFIKGIMAGFNGDFVTAISILAPQIENSIRQLAEVCGDCIVKINDDYTEDVLSLDYILTQPKINECVREDILFNLKTIFTSKFGCNIRNEVAHGILDDDDFDLTACYYAWWFTLRLCVEFSSLHGDIILKLNEKIEPVVTKYNFK